MLQAAPEREIRMYNLGPDGSIFLSEEMDDETLRQHELEAWLRRGEYAHLSAPHLNAVRVAIDSLQRIRREQLVSS